MTAAARAAPPTPQPREAALFLDIDGTLIPFADRPEDVVADGMVRHLLTALETAFEGALVLVSGRPVVDIDRIFAPHRFVSAGEHGSEIRLAHRRRHEECPPPPGLAGLRALCRGLVQTLPGLLLEEKPHSLSLHYRAVPEHGVELRAALLGALETRPDWTLVEGNRVFELVPAAASKGAAIRRLMTEPLFRDRRPFFVGDDTNDEPGFVAVNTLGGVSIKVGPGPSAARYGLSDPAAVRDWLALILVAQEAGVHAPS